MYEVWQRPNESEVSSPKARDDVSNASQVPALPRGSTVEVQPVLLAPPSAEDPGVVGRLQPWGKNLSLNPAAAARGEASEPLLVSRALLAPRRLCCCHAAAAAAALPDLDLTDETRGPLATDFEV